jgi:hypothetical protein
LRFCEAKAKQKQKQKAEDSRGSAEYKIKDTYSTYHESLTPNASRHGGHINICFH